MANELSNGCVQAIELVDDEKEEGEISLDDVSSSEEGQPYLPKELPNCCPHCKSVRTCATWCGSLITYKNNIRKGAEIQGKENRINRQHSVENSDSFLNVKKKISVKHNQYKTQRKKNNIYDNELQKNDTDGLVPISSDSDLNLEELELDKPKKKTSSKKRHKKRRKKPDLLLSAPADIALVVKESIHQVESKKESSRSKPARHQSPEKRQSSPRRHNHSPITKSKRCPKSPQPSIPSRKKLSPTRQRKRKSPCLSPNKITDEFLSESPSSRVCVTRLLKKVRRHEPFSCKAGEKGSSLKDKLSGIIKTDTKVPVKTGSQDNEKKALIVEQTIDIGAKDSKKEPICKENLINEDSVADVIEVAFIVKNKSIEETKNKDYTNSVKSNEVPNKKEKSPQLVEAVKVDSKVEVKAPVSMPLQSMSTPLRPTSPLGQSDVTPPLSPSVKLPNFCMDDNEEDLELRMIALHSAVLKKHRTRMQKIGVQKTHKTQNMLSFGPFESPFTASFFKDLSQSSDSKPVSMVNCQDEIYCPEDMDLDSDLELDKELSALDVIEVRSAPSPSYEIVNQQYQQNNIENAPEHASTPKKKTSANMTLYSPSKPTETPARFNTCSDLVSTDDPSLNKDAWKLPATNDLNGSIFEFANHESRPYSPTDMTVYDPELPGVHSNDKSSNNDNVAVPPLLPPPLPPLDILDGEDSMVLECPTNVVADSFSEPMAPPLLPPPSLLSNFVAAPQPLNPLLLSATLFPFTAPVVPAAPSTLSLVNSAGTPASSLAELLSGVARPVVNVSPPLQKLDALIECANSQRIAVEIKSNKLDDFGETDLDGSPLVPMDKITHSSWPFLSNAQCHLGDASKNIQTIPSGADFEENRPLHPNNEAFKNLTLKSIPLNFKKNSLFKSMTVQGISNKSMLTSSAAAFNMSTENDTKESEKELEYVPTLSERLRANQEEKIHLKQQESNNMKRKKSINPRGQINQEIFDNMASDSDIKNNKKMKKNGDDSGCDEDEEALREQLLASLKNKKNRSLPSRALINAKSLLFENIKKKLTKNSPSVILNSHTDKNKNSENSCQNIESLAVTMNIPTMKRPSPNEMSDQKVQKISKKTSITPVLKKAANNSKQNRNSLRMARFLSTKQKLAASKKLNSILPSSTQKLINSNCIENSVTNEKENKLENEPDAVKKKTIEMNVEQFLKNIRFQQECATAKNITKSDKTSTSKSIEKEPSNSAQSIQILSSDSATKTPTSLRDVTINSNINFSDSHVDPKTPISTALVTSTNFITSSTFVASHIDKKKFFLDTPKNSGLKKLNLAIPQALKHLPVSKQEEYHRLKHQIMQREKLQLQKSKEATAAATITNLNSPAITSSLKGIQNSAISDSTSVIFSPPKTFSTPNAEAKVSSTSTSVTALTTPSIIALTPEVSKTIISLPSSTSISTSDLTKAFTLKPPQTSTPIVESSSLKLSTASSEMQVATTTAEAINSLPKQQVKVAIASKMQTVITSNNKTGALITNTASSSSNKNNVGNAIAGPRKISQLKNSSNISKLSKEQAALLDKMNSVLNSQKKQISAVVQKVSTLRILTKDQINLKTTKIQQAEPKACVQMDDLNKSDKNVVANIEEPKLVEKSLHKDSEEISIAIIDERAKSVTNRGLSVASNNIQSKSQNLAENTGKQSSLVDASANVEKSSTSWNEFKLSVDDEMESLHNLPFEKQKKLLTECEERLINKRHLVLDDITEMSGSLRQWEIERDLQNDVTLEIEKLRERLRMAEEKLQQQKEKLNSIQPKVSMYHKKINNGRKECFRLSKICDTLGQTIAGSSYKVPTAGAELLNNRIKEVANHTQRLKNKATRKNLIANSSSAGIKNRSKSNKNSCSNFKNIACEPTNVNNLNKSVIEISMNDDSISMDKTINIISNSENTKQIKVENQTIEEINNEALKINAINNNNSSNLPNFIGVNVDNTNIVNSNTTTLKTNEQSAECYGHKVVIKTEKIDDDVIMDTSSIISIKTNNGNLVSSVTEGVHTVMQPENRLHSENAILLNNNFKKLNNRPSSLDNNANARLNIIETENHQLVNKNKDKICINSKNNCAEHENLSSKNSSANDNFENRNCLNKSLAKINISFDKECNDNENMSVVIIEDSVKDDTKNESAKNSGPIRKTLKNNNLNSQNDSESKFEEPSSKSMSKSLNSLSNDIILLDIEKPSGSKVLVQPQTLEFDQNNLKNLEKNNKQIIVNSEDSCKSKNTSNCSSKSKNSTLLEEISLLEIANNIVVPKTISLYKQPTKLKNNLSFSKKIMGQDDKSKNTAATKNKIVEPYESILKPLYYGSRNKIDAILCPYQLTGTCNDEDCQYTHLRTGHFS